MSVLHIGAALEAALDAISPPIDTDWENGQAFEPINGTPYQAVSVLFARPDNAEIGPQYVQRGFMQVTLMYPLNAGSGAAVARADLLRSTFRRGLSLTSGGVIVTIEKTPEIMPGFRDGDRYAVPVRVPFFAPVNT